MLLLHPTIAPWRQRKHRGCLIRLLVKGTPQQVFLRAEPHNEELLIHMRPEADSNGFTRYEAELPWDTGNVATHYVFKVLHDGRQSWLAADGVHAFLPARELHFKVSREHTPPDWVADQVFYQIFPDRFCQGDASLAVRTDEYVFRNGQYRVVKKSWGEAIDPALHSTAFYGGDLVGIRQQLDYLQNELGITALYLNPIFTSGSNHKYDTEDYFNVDPHLGGNAALVALSSALKQRGMRLVLDAVVNHTSYNHPWFNRWGQHDSQGAYQSAASPWRDWYVFNADGRYQGWKGFQSLPVLDYANPAVRAVVYENPASILRHWLRAPYAIDGWRFDVIHMLGEGEGARNNARYVAAFRQAMREENPQAYVMGEHFSEASRWLQGDQEDGAMNYYGFAVPVRAWLANIDIAYQPAQLDTATFARWLLEAQARIPYENQLAQLNLLDSHDTARFFTLVNESLPRMQLAVTLLLSYPGTPCIYYGDEIGLTGGNDPDCRRCFDWQREHWNAALFAHYQRLIGWRQQREEWRRGAFQLLHAADDTLVYARYTGTQATVVAMNRGPQPARLALEFSALPIALPHWQTLAGDTLAAGERLSLELPAESFWLAFGD